MGHRTPLYDAHLAAGARMVDFGGWDMPIHYGSQIEEHHQVRRDAGMFDVSHMTIVDVTGDDAEPWLRYLLANDVARLKTVGKALYTGMLNEEGGVLDDLIVYRRENGFRLVVNCATREKDLAWMQKQAQDYAVNLTEQPDLAMIAVQGPNARDKAARVLSDEAAEAMLALKPFSACEQGDWMICRTGYTGEDGLEIMLPAASAPAFWAELTEEGVRPCGLGARDTLRLEAGMNLYGQDMDETVTPLESNMGWTVAWAPQDRAFIGREALEKQRQAGKIRQLTGLVMRQRGVLRPHQKVITEQGEGEITSGTFSPTLGFSIALARLPADVSGTVRVELRGKQVEAEVVRPPFVRNGQCVFE